MAEKCRRKGGLHFFVKEFWEEVVPDEFVDAKHIEFLCDELQTLGMNVIARKPKLYDLIANVPPGTSKTTIFTIMFPAWLWACDPTIRILSFSYSADLALKHAVKSRDIIRSRKYKAWFPWVKIKPDRDNKSEYATTAGGERMATSVGGTATGNHAHIQIGDDPINAQEGESEAKRNTANQFCTQTMSTRKVDKELTPLVLVMQRLHTDDPTGHLLKLDPTIRHICLPARESDDIKPAAARAIYQNGLLDPVRLSVNALGQLERVLGSYGTAGQLQQRPAPADGAIWSGKWFIPVEDSVFPMWYQLDNYGTDYDTALTAKQINDASGYITSGYKDGNIYIDKAGAVRKEFPQLCRFMAKMPLPAYIEAKASGQSAKQTLSDQGIAAIEVPVTGGDKVARARLATPEAEAGNVYVRASILEYLLNDSEQGILAFPNGLHDDVQDALTQAIQRHSKYLPWVI